MDHHAWCIFALMLIVSAGAARYDLGPQKFYESSSPAPSIDQNGEDKEVVLYLTPSQIRALEIGGAVVRPQEPENDPREGSEDTEQKNEDQPEENFEQEQEQEQGQEQEDNESEAEQPGQEVNNEQREQDQEREEELQSQDFALEEILRILNEERLEQEEEEVAAERVRNEPQVTEETSEEDNSEDVRQIFPRFQARQNQQKIQSQIQSQEKYFAPIAQNTRSKVYSAIRYQRIEEPQRSIVQFPRQQQQDARQTQEEQLQTQALALLKRYKLVPFKNEEQSKAPALVRDEQVQQAQQEQEQAQQQLANLPAEEQKTQEQVIEDRLSALLSPFFSPEKLAEVIAQRKNKLSQNELELQAILKELKKSSKHNDQKYAIEIEKLRKNLQKQNALAKAEVIAKTAPQLIGKEIQKRRPSPSAKLVKAPADVARQPELLKQKAPRPQPVLVQVRRPVPVPVLKTIQAPRSLPVEVQKRVSVPVATRNVYVKVNKPYLVERIVPVEIKREDPVDIPVRNPESLTILRHIWEH